MTRCAIAMLLEELRQCGDVASDVSEVVPKVVDVCCVGVPSGEQRCPTRATHGLLDVVEPEHCAL